LVRPGERGDELSNGLGLQMQIAMGHKEKEPRFSGSNFP
jgi:hypothetical protein